MDHAPHQPLLVTADAALADELARLAAAAGGRRRGRARPAPTALRAWSDRAGWCSSAPTSCRRWSSSRRRAGPASTSSRWSPVPTGSFRDALLVGAERVVELPVGAELVAELLTDLEEAGRGEGVLVGVVGGSGGAGATTLACALGQVAAARRADARRRPRPAGARVSTGCSASTTRRGVRWDSLGTASGRLSGALAARGGAAPRRPRRPGVGRPRPAALDAGAVREALSAARRGHDMVVVDLPRVRATSWPRRSRGARLVVLVVVPTVTGVAAAARLGGRAARPGPGRGCWSVVGGADPRRRGRARRRPGARDDGRPARAGRGPRPGPGPVRSRRGPLGRRRPRAPRRPRRPRRSQHEHRRGRARGRRPGPRAARRPPGRPHPAPGRRGAAGGGPSGRRRHGARGLRSAASRRARRRAARAAAPAAGRHRRAGQRTRRRSTSTAATDSRRPASGSPTTSPCAGSPSGWPAWPVGASTTPRRSSTCGCPTAPASTRCSRRCPGPAPSISLRVPPGAGLHPRRAGRRGHPDAGRGRAAAGAGRGPGGLPGQRRHRQRQDDAAGGAAVPGRPGRAARPRRGRLRAAPGPSARRRARGAAGQRRGRGRDRPPHPGPAGAADASRPAGRRRGARRRGGRPAGRPQHRPRRRLRHPPRQLRRRRAGPARGARPGRRASTGRRPTASSPPGSPRSSTSRAGRDGVRRLAEIAVPRRGADGLVTMVPAVSLVDGALRDGAGAAELARVLGR